MRTTGIVRRVDDLGRVVIPREIRKQIGIKEGEPLEIFVDPQTKMVGFQKYRVDPLNREEILNKFAEMDIEDQVELLNELMKVYNGEEV